MGCILFVLLVGWFVFETEFLMRSTKTSNFLIHDCQSKQD